MTGPRLVLAVHLFPQVSETFIVGKFLGLLARGWDVHVSCSAIDRDALRAFPQLSPALVHDRVHERPATRARAVASRPGPALAALRALPALARAAGPPAAWGAAGVLAVRPDLVHHEFGTVAHALAPSLASAGVTQSVSFRGYDLHSVALADDAYYDAVWPVLSGVHVLGDDLRRRALERGCPPDLPCVLIPPAVDLAVFHPPPGERSSGSATFRLVGVGRLDWKKGYEFALAAVRLLVDRGIDASFTIVGTGEFLEAVAFARHQLALDDRVRLVGAADRTEVRNLLWRSDAFVHAAVVEGFGNAVLEAQAVGLPVVTSDAGGLPENVDDGVTGFVVRRRDPGAMADALERLARDRDLRRRMGDAGVYRVRRHFSIDDQIAAFDAFYRSLPRPG